MARIFWVWYHTQDIGTSAGTTTFFNTDQATAGKAKCNMKMAGQLPAAEKFKIESIQVSFEPQADPDDVEKILSESVLELVIGEETKLIAPLIHFVPNGHLAGYAALYGQSSATEVSAATPAGYPLRLDPPIELPGGVGFKVDIITTNAPSSATACTVSLVGEREY